MIPLLKSLNRTLVETATSDFQKRLIGALDNADVWLNESPLYSEPLDPRTDFPMPAFTPRLIMQLWTLARLGRVNAFPRRNPNEQEGASRRYLVTLSKPNAGGLPPTIPETMEIVEDLVEKTRSAFFNQTGTTLVIPKKELSISSPAALFVALGTFMAGTGIRVNVCNENLVLNMSNPLPLQSGEDPVSAAVDALVAKYRTF